jgi:hypothetical protein
LRWIGTRFHDAIIFHVPLAAVKHHINSRIDVPSPEPGILGNIGTPLGGIISEIIIAYSRELLEKFETSIWTRTRHFHPDR